MKHIHLIHWNEAERLERAQWLSAAGFSVEPLDLRDGSASLKAVRAAPPDAFVIDLGRLPSHGREVALALRQSTATRQVPIVFVEGDPAKVKRIRELLPDAVYTHWKQIARDVRRAIAKAPSAPVLPRTTMDAYANTPLAKKLGLKDGMKVALINAPQRWEESIDAPPAGLRWLRRPRAPCDLVIWFVTARHELEDRIDRVSEFIGDGGMWIAWPKKGSRAETDVNQNDVRQVALAAGLVDYKVCSISAIWSALRFARKATR